MPSNGRHRKKGPGGPSNSSKMFGSHNKSGSGSTVVAGGWLVELVLELAAPAQLTSSALRATSPRSRRNLREISLNGGPKHCFRIPPCGVVGRAVKDRLPETKPSSFESFYVFDAKWRGVNE